MSTVPEVIVARHAGIRVAAISAITNLAVGMSAEPIDHEQTLRGAALAAADLTRLVRAFVGVVRRRGRRGTDARYLRPGDGGLSHAAAGGHPAPSATAARSPTRRSPSSSAG